MMDTDQMTAAESVSQGESPARRLPSAEGPSWSYTERGARRLLIALVVIELSLMAVYLFTQLVIPSWGLLGSLFNVGLDQSVPSWFSTIQLAAVGATFLLAAHSNHSAIRLPAWLLVAAAVIGFYLSADEGAGIHERVTSAVDDADLNWMLFKDNHGGWIAVYAIAVVLAVALASKWLRLLWSECRYEAVIGLVGVVIYLVGGAVLEAVGYVVDPERGTVLETTLTAIEEFMEMAGVSIVLYAALLLALRVGTDPAVGPRP